MFDVSDVMRTVLLSIGHRRGLRFGDLEINCGVNGVSLSNPSLHIPWEDFTYSLVMKHMDMFHHIYNVPCTLIIGMEQYYHELLKRCDSDTARLRGTACPDVSRVTFEYNGREFTLTAHHGMVKPDLLCIDNVLIPPLSPLSDPDVRLARLNIYGDDLQVQSYSKGSGMVVIYKVSSSASSQDIPSVGNLLGLDAWAPADKIFDQSSKVDIPVSSSESGNAPYKHIFSLMGDDRPKEKRYLTLMEALSAMGSDMPDKLDAFLTALEMED